MVKVMDVLKDGDLSIEAKSIYVYLRSYRRNNVQISIKYICDDLGITQQRYYRHVKGLVDKRYIKITRPDGIYTMNRYEFM